MFKKSLLIMMLMAAFLPLALHAQQALPYSYGFEDNDLSVDGWVKQTAQTNSGIFNNSGSSHEGDYLFRFHYNENPGYLISPLLTGTDNGVDVTFYYANYSSSYNEKFQVGYTTDESVTDPSAFTYGDVITCQTLAPSYTKYEGTMPNGTKRIAIKYNYTNAYYLYLDDFSFTAAADCKKPQGLTCTSANESSITLDWTEIGTATEWQLCLNGDESNLINVTEKPYTVPGLTSLTPYTVKVRAVCSEYSDWTDEINCSTTAVATPVGDSWSDDFEGASCGWELINGTLTNANWVWGEAVNNGGTHSIYVSNDNGATNSYNASGYAKVYATKLLTFTDGKYAFQFDWKCVGESSYDYLRVGLVPATTQLVADGTSSSQDNPTGWIALHDQDKLSAQSTWTTSPEKTIQITAGSYYLVLRWRQDSGTQNGAPAAVDNVVITKMACPYDVTGLEYDPESVTTNSATINWTDGEPHYWQVDWSKDNTFAPENTNTVYIATNTKDLENLDAASTYYVRVRAFCGGEDYGSWSTTISFDTECEIRPALGYDEKFDTYTASSGYLPICWTPINGGTSYNYYPCVYGNTAYSASNCLYFYSYGSASSTTITDQYAVLPEMSGLEGLQLSFMARGYSGSANVIKIGMMEDPTDVSTFTLLDSKTLTTTYEEFNIILTGEGNHVAFLMEKPTSSSSTTVGVYIDNISIHEAPTCIKPTDLTKGEVTAHTAELSWTSDAEAWQICVNDDEENLIDVTTTSYTLEELTAETTYTVKVRTVCESSDVSDWTSAISFTTAIACPKPTALTATLTPGDGSIATLSWTEAGEASEWVLEYSINSDFTDATSLNVSDTPSKDLDGLTAEVTYYARVKAVCGGIDGESAWSDVCSFIPTNAYSITINEGDDTNEFVPVYGYYADATSMSQFIIPADDIKVMQWGTISKLTFYVSSPQNATLTKTTSPYTPAEFEVYMGTTASTTFADATLDWSIMDIVMNAAHLEVSNYMMEITLDAPYQYTGGNLMIGVKETTGGGYAHTYWKGIPQNENTAIGNKNNSGSSYELKQFLPMTTFDYTPGEEPSCLKPNGLAVEVTGNEAIITWESDAESWQLCFNDDEENLIDVKDKSYTFTGEYATTYTVKVRTNCDSETYSEWTANKSFSTDECAPEDICELSYELKVTEGYEAYGWYGSYLLVYDNEENLLAYWTVEYDEGTATGTLGVCDGKELVFSWYSGSDYDDLLIGSIKVYDVGGNLIIDSNSALTDDVEYTMNCNACPAVTGVTATAGVNSAVVSWEGEHATFDLQYKQDITYHFEDGLGSWTTIDADGDGFNWLWSEAGISGYQGTKCLYSQSYDNNGEQALDPDNYLVSPKVKLGGSISFYACSQDGGWLEHFGVAVSTTGNTSAADFTTIQDWTCASAKDQSPWTLYTADLSEYAGEEGYVAIRHYDSGNNFYLDIDEITILEPGQTMPEWILVEDVTSPYTLEPLTEETTYAVQVRGYCQGETEPTPWSSLVNFTTVSGNVFIANGGNWNVDENWLGGSVPEAGSGVVIAASVIVPAGYVADAGKITVEGNATITVEDGGQLKTTYGGVAATMKKSIDAHSGVGEEMTGWNFIASPVISDLSPIAVTNLMTDSEEDYDLYAFDETATDAEWVNYKQHNETFMIYNGQGYLYANAGDVDLEFTGELNPTNLSKKYTLEAEGTGDFAGFFLMGNPFSCNAYLAGGEDFYVMNEDRNDIVPAISNTIAPLQGYFVKVDGSLNLNVTTTAPVNDGKGLIMSLSQNRGHVTDNAIIRFGEGNGLSKIQLNPKHTKLYIPQDNKDYAVVYSNTEGEMPVNFKAEKMGQYTISFNLEGTSFGYMHLYDKLTGNDVNLLTSPNYTFTGTPQDNEDRFILRFSSSASSDIFAYQSGSDVIVSGEGTLQVFDVLGRYVDSYEINGVQTIKSMPMGVYIFRMIGNEVKTQKIVVR
jgi:hypothetical protein